MVKINGEDVNANGKKLTDYLKDAGYDNRFIAVEINEEIISKSQYAETVLKDGDVVEVVNFVGGG